MSSSSHCQAVLWPPAFAQTPFHKKETEHLSTSSQQAMDVKCSAKVACPPENPRVHYLICHLHDLFPAKAGIGWQLLAVQKNTCKRQTLMYCWQLFLLHAHKLNFINVIPWTKWVYPWGHRRSSLHLETYSSIYSMFRYIYIYITIYFLKPLLEMMSRGRPRPTWTKPSKGFVEVSDFASL